MAAFHLWRQRGWYKCPPFAELGFQNAFYVTGQLWRHNCVTMGLGVERGCVPTARIVRVYRQYTFRHSKRIFYDKDRTVSFRALKYFIKTCWDVVYLFLFVFELFMWKMKRIFPGLLRELKTERCEIRPARDFCLIKTFIVSQIERTT